MHDRWSLSEQGLMVLSGACRDDRFRAGLGVACLTFAESGRIWGISWQSTVRADSHEALFALVHARKAAAPDRDILLSVHHVNRHAATTHNRDVSLARPVPVEAGDEIWIFADGYVPGYYGTKDPRHALLDRALEVQAVLWVEKNSARAGGGDAR